jgi:hypothetical protein
MQGYKIVILRDHKRDEIIGKIENNIIEFLPDAKVTAEMLFDAFNGGLIILEDEWIDSKTRYIKKALIEELSICTDVK